MARSYRFRRFGTAADLRRAVERDQLRLEYQPIVSTADGRMVAVEALLRWEHPALGVVGPDQFIGLAEETGLIIPIGDWVLEEACKHAAQWRSLHPELETSVNVSVLQLADRAFVDRAARAIRSSHVAPGSLSFEITETLPRVDLDAMAASVAGLRSLGCRVGLDDFGAGYAGLPHLDEFGVDFIKVDRSLVARMSGDGRLLGAVVAMARVLVVDVVAEGVETPRQLDRIRTLGCRRAQGFHFSKPLRPEELASRLALAA